MVERLDRDRIPLMQRQRRVRERSMGAYAYGSSWFMEGFGVVQGGGDAAGAAGGEPANLHLWSVHGWRAAAPCIGIKGGAGAADAIISCDSVVWATSVVHRRR